MCCHLARSLMSNIHRVYIKTYNEVNVSCSRATTQQHAAARGLPRAGAAVRNLGREHAGLKPECNYYIDAVAENDLIIELACFWLDDVNSFIYEYQIDIDQLWLKAQCNCLTGVGTLIKFVQIITGLRDEDKRLQINHTMLS